MRTYMGIDCGLDGAVYYTDFYGRSRFVMPTIKKGKGREIDIIQLDERIFELNPNFVIVEDPGGHAPSAAGLRSMTRSFAIVETILKLRSIPHLSLLSQKWQKEFWTKPKMPKGKKFDTKAEALRVAKQLNPQENWLATERSKKPHDGLVDAYLLTEYGRRKNL